MKKWWWLLGGSTKTKLAVQIKTRFEVWTRSPFRKLWRNQSPLCCTVLIITVVISKYKEGVMVNWEDGVIDEARSGFCTGQRKRKWQERRNDHVRWEWSWLSTQGWQWTVDFFAVYLEPSKVHELPGTGTSAQRRVLFLFNCLLVQDNSHLPSS